MSESQPARTHSEYWFDDGNVVLQVEHTLFRVHQSILSRHSQVFQDMFSIPHAPSQENEYIEGCPVIPLSDTAKDVSNILTLLYNPRRTLQFGRRLPSAVLGSMLRLGKKYDIATFEEEALSRLHHDHPTDLFKWDTLDHSDPHNEFDEFIIPIAHEFGLFTILPAAYLKFLQCQYLEAVANLVDSNCPHFSKEMRRHCILGYTRIQNFVKEKCVDALCPPLVLPSKQCGGGATCEANKWRAIKDLHIWVIEDEDICPGILGSLEILSNGLMVKTVCFQCQNALRVLIRKVRYEFWSMLPTFFGLPAWADLKDES